MEESVGLRPFIAALLPPEAREHVLGDLEESGFRLRDAVSAVGASWASYFRREWLGPVPNLSTASDRAVEDRIQRLLRARQAGVCLFLAASLASFLARTGAPVEPLTFTLGLYFVLRLCLPVAVPSVGLSIFAPPPSLVEQYRALLGTVSWSSWIPIFAWMRLCQTLPRPVRFYALLGLIVIGPPCFYRHRRLSRELGTIPLPSSRPQ
jgi:hypothetical protein